MADPTKFREEFQNISDRYQSEWKQLISVGDEAGHSLEFSKDVRKEKEKLQEIDDAYSLFASRHGIDLSKDEHYIEFQEKSQEILALFDAIQKMNNEFQFSDGQIAALTFTKTRKAIHQIVKDYEKQNILEPNTIKTLKTHFPEHTFYSSPSSDDE